MIQIENFSFLGLIALSYLMVRFGFDAKVFAGIPKLLFTFCYPALILTSFAVLDSDLSQQHVIFTVVFTVVSTGLIYALTSVVLSRYQNAARREVIAFYTAVGNVTFVGLPFIFYFFGPFGLSFAILYGVVQDMLIWSVIYTRFAGRGSLRQGIKTLLNPCFIAVILGFIVAQSPWTLPGTVELPIRLLADATIPLALLCIGSLLAESRGALKAIDRDALLAVGVKTFIVPVLGFGILRLFGIDQTLALLCSFILFLPAPLLSVLFSKEFGKDVDFANVLFVVSTLLFLLICVGLFALQTAGIIPRI